MAGLRRFIIQSRGTPPRHHDPRPTVVGIFARRPWWVSWASTVAVAALGVTVLDAILLQRKWNYFTGGFLATDYVRTWPQAFGFILGSLLTDAAVVAAPIAVV